MVNGQKTKPMYMKQGVKQGCNMSPTLFNIFLLDIIKLIDAQKLGIKIDDTIVTIIAFADDLVLASLTYRTMNKLMQIMEAECAAIGMEVSQDKSKSMRIGSTTPTTVSQKTLIQDYDLDQVLVFKYLGAKLSNKPHRYFEDFSEQCLTKTKSYKNTIVAKAKSSEDAITVVTELWLKVAVPSILYGSEVIPIRKAELTNLDQIASTMGKIILQLPKNTTNVTSVLLAGIPSITYEYMKRANKQRLRYE